MHDVIGFRHSSMICCVLNTSDYTRMSRLATWRHPIWAQGQVWGPRLGANNSSTCSLFSTS